jgi:hypothetical protein
MSQGIRCRKYVRLLWASYESKAMCRIGSLGWICQDARPSCTPPGSFRDEDHDRDRVKYGQNMTIRIGCSAEQSIAGELEKLER